MHLPPSKDFITTREAAKLAGYSSDYLARLARLGEIVGRQVGRAWLIEVESLRAYLLVQGDRKVDRARSLARAREEEYRIARSSVVRAVKVIRALPPALSLSTLVPQTRSLASQALALAIALVVVGGGAYAAHTGKVAALTSSANALALETSLGFTAMVSDVPATIALRLERAQSGVALSQLRVARPIAEASGSLSPDLSLAIVTQVSDNSVGRAFALASMSTGPWRPQSSAVLAVSAPVAPVMLAQVVHTATQVFDVAASPDEMFTLFIAAHRAIGERAYRAVVSGLGMYLASIEVVGARALM